MDFDFEVPKVVEQERCPICMSTRVVEGGIGRREEGLCQDCGSQFNREVRRESTPEEISVAIQAETPNVPEGGFSSIEEAQAHLAKLKEVSKKNKFQSFTIDKINQDDIDPNIVMAVYHFYQRSGEQFGEVVNTGKGERAVRNYNVLIWVHNHPVGRSCTKSCKELKSD